VREIAASEEPGKLAGRVVAMAFGAMLRSYVLSFHMMKSLFEA
jgi:hypothetical protein